MLGVGRLGSGSQYDNLAYNNGTHCVLEVTSRININGTLRETKRERQRTQRGTNKNYVLAR